MSIAYRSLSSSLQALRFLQGVAIQFFIPLIKSLDFCVLPQHKQSKRINFVMYKVFVLLSLFLSSPICAAPAPSPVFLTLADLHFDPFISCRIKKEHPCPLITALEQAPIEKWSAIFAHYDTQEPRYGQDSNNLLLQSALAQAHQASEDHHTQFILILGDFLGHHFTSNFKHYAANPSPTSYRLFVNKTLAYINLLLTQSFPSQDVYAVVGNNDNYHGDYFTAPHTPFFNDTAALWSQLIKNKKNRALMRKEFTSAGYYKVVISPASLRLLVLNSVLFSYKARGKNVQQAADRQLTWLHQELQNARDQHQSVIIAMHIPMRLDVYATAQFHLFTLAEFWRPAYLDRFEKELTTFSAEISAVLTGHLHYSWLQTKRISPSHNILLAGSPAISPIYGNPPGFTLYHCTVPDCQEIELLTSFSYSLGHSHHWVQN